MRLSSASPKNPSTSPRTNQGIDFMGVVLRHDDALIERKTSPPPLPEAGRGDQFGSAASLKDCALPKTGQLSIVFAPPRFGAIVFGAAIARGRGGAGRR